MNLRQNNNNKQPDLSSLYDLSLDINIKIEKLSVDHNLYVECIKYQTDISVLVKKFLELFRIQYQTDLHFEVFTNLVDFLVSITNIYEMISYKPNVVLKRKVAKNHNIPKVKKIKMVDKIEHTEYSTIIDLVNDTNIKLDTIIQHISSFNSNTKVEFHDIQKRVHFFMKKFVDKICTPPNCSVTCQDSTTQQFSNILKYISQSSMETVITSIISLYNNTNNNNWYVPSSSSSDNVRYGDDMQILNTDQLNDVLNDVSIGGEQLYNEALKETNIDYDYTFNIN